MKKIFFLIAIMFFLANCKENKNHKKILINDSLPLSELIDIVYQLEDDSDIQKVTNMINDSLIKRDYIQIFSVQSINDFTKEVTFNLYVNDNFYYSTVRYFFQVSINSEDSILVENKLINIDEIDNIEKLANEFIISQDSSNSYKEKVDFFGEVCFVKTGLKLYVKGKDKKGLSKEMWKIVLKCMRQLVSVYENKKDEISMKKWGVKYETLSFEKKIAVCEMTGFLIRIYMYNI